MNKSVIPIKSNCGSKPARNDPLAKDLTSANAIAQTIRYQYRVVSLEGDVMNAGGSMTGGANKRGNQGSLFVQNQELKQLTSEFEEADKQLKHKKKFRSCNKKQLV